MVVSLFEIPNPKYQSASLHYSPSIPEIRTYCVQCLDLQISDLASAISFYHLVQTMGIASGTETVVVLCLQLLYDTLFYFVYQLVGSSLLD